MLGYNMFAYCNNNPVMFSDPTGEFIFGAILLALGCVAVVGLSSCTFSNNSPEQTIDASDTSWIKDDPFIQTGRHESFDDALNDAINEGKSKANCHNKEVGYYIYEQYGGYYVSQPISGWMATERSVIIDISKAPDNARVVATLHTHPWHNDNLIYQPMEYDNIKKTNIPDYVVDIHGCVYVLSPESKGYTDYQKLR